MEWLRQVSLYIMRRVFPVVVFAFWAHPSFGLSPMEYFNSLVAGGEDLGYQDGHFAQARFREPSGLAFDDTGDRLFVADSKNHRIRVINLRENNRVDTVAGSDKSGNADGPLQSATFNLPTALAFIPGNKLVVYERGNRLLRIIDLSKKTVATLAGQKEKGPPVVAAHIVYQSQADLLYYSEPENHRLQKLNLTSGEITTVFSNQTEVPSPVALCLNENKIFVSDFRVPDVYRVDPAANTLSGSVSLAKMGSAEYPIRSMTASDGIVYVLQEGPVVLARVFPKYEPVSLATPWGFLIDNINPGAEPFLQLTGPDNRCGWGFAASPVESRKLYIAWPMIWTHGIVSVKDYEFEKHWLAASEYRGANRAYPITDFPYPKRKPFKTFRILVVGDSMVLKGPPIIPDIKPGDKIFDEFKYSRDSEKMFLFSKQLEFLLNIQSALRDGPNFEVLILGVPGTPVGRYIWKDVPPLVKDYGIDLVFGQRYQFC